MSATYRGIFLASPWFTSVKNEFFYSMGEGPIFYSARYLALPNLCEIVEMQMNKEVIGRWGDKCGKWSNMN